ncbi:energy-coupling factor transporter ATPase [Facklamia sp. HMSC062C11]|uniref:energy-coupling factor ABC transporter ATP-binding protein n=1 Tax=Facklamia sp. HMSC062C11 TaxID=1739262 RepID=UPI0008A59D08|nr:energy-coupling factor ABC transporter ATP-binding protein [Facklamia sp. HMSC062C11]OFL67529.1 energy-coupling factor transporter ATPase [Facklamia sp. HMSC062C11]
MEAIINVQDLSFRYPNASRDALNSVSFSVNKGEWLAVIGPNGSGKSTLAKMINGLLAPYQGSVEVNGRLLNEDSLWQIRKEVGIVFQNPDNQFVGATVEDDVAFGLENLGIDRQEMVQRIHEVLKQVRMEAFLKKEPAKLSGGQKQRVAIAGILALRPDVIILDESTSMLDPLGRKTIIKTVRELKEKYQLTVISITHDIDEASQADRILILKEGKVMKLALPEAVFSLGEDLIAMGLDLPFAEKLRLCLKEQDVPVPDKYLTEEELVEWLSQSYLTK